ncbi:hypothetical protein BGW80DRAFT_1461060 [Lactifluus volemus]|nr:hypothetical protein BGW80DRAFT_1461060 [Lactifluus volemus]
MSRFSQLEAQSLNQLDHESWVRFKHQVGAAGVDITNGVSLTLPSTYLIITFRTSTKAGDYHRFVTDRNYPMKRRQGYSLHRTHAIEHVQVDDIRQIITLPDTDALGDLNIGQKRTLVCHELERTLGRLQNMADTLLVSRKGATTLETHHVFAIMKVSLAALPQPNDGEAICEEAAKRLTHALHRLGQLNLTSTHELYLVVVDQDAFQEALQPYCHSDDSLVMSDNTPESSTALESVTLPSG